MQVFLAVHRNNLYRFSRPLTMRWEKPVNNDPNEPFQILTEIGAGLAFLAVMFAGFVFSLVPA